MKNKQVNKGIRVVIGSMIMGIGISLTIWANVGSDPLTIFWIGIAQNLSISVGQANLLVSAVILCLVFFMDKKQIHIGSIVNPIVIALTTELMANFTLILDNFAMRSILCLIGLLILAFGIALYALADYGKGAYEALVFCLNKRSHLSIGIIRTTCDILFAIIGMLLGGPIAFGTILAILCMGSAISFFVNKMKVIVE